MLFLRLEIIFILSNVIRMNSDESEVIWFVSRATVVKNEPPTILLAALRIGGNHTSIHCPFSWYASRR